jgi:hypothetical protein
VAAPALSPISVLVRKGIPVTHFSIMSGPLQKPWSDKPNAPQVPYPVYFEEKANFAGILIGAILYGTQRFKPTHPFSPSLVRFTILGIVVVLSPQCMNALISPVNRARGGIKWGLVAHTVAMFSVVTVYTAITLNTLFTSYIDNREFPGVDGISPPGPVGYQYSTYANTMNAAATVMFLLNNWLADGLLASFVSSSVVRVSHVDLPSSSIVATFFILGTTGTTGPSLYHV